MKERPLLIVEDDPALRQTLAEGFSRTGYSVQVAESMSAALKIFEQKLPDLIIADIRLPDGDGIKLLESIQKRPAHVPVILMTGFGTVQDAVSAMRKGAFDYLLKPFSLEALEEVVERALGDAAAPPETGPGEEEERPLWTQDKSIADIMSLCRRIAPSRATVLIQGESGTGKELLARYIHARSGRTGAFVAVNCASLPETLLESELFGHEKGAFTGAIGRKIGKFELAHNGTLLLDEISEMNTFLQAKILRVLQEGEVDRIGGTRPVPVDIRVIATTNRNLEASIAKGEFREDLYYRLNVIEVHVPPLRERGGDVEYLAGYFQKKFAADYNRPVHSISEAARTWLSAQEWRGNVRELKNRVERAVLTSSRNELGVADFTGRDEESPRAKTPEEISWSSLCLREMEEKMIFRALEKTNGNRTHAAKMLGISIRTLRNKLNEYRLNPVAGEGF
jgi:two-component system, response regulator FlrC